jgi:hemerythrin-like domain-containing protein
MTYRTDPAELLKGEHTAVLQKLGMMETAIRNLERRERVSAVLKELMAFFASDFWLHFDKEEKALFPEFDNFMPRGVGPLAAMLDEHELIRGTNELLQEAVARYLEGDDTVETRNVIIEKGLHFVEFLRGHIAKEDGLFARMVELHLGPRQNERVVRLFAEMEQAGSGQQMTE